MRLLRRLCRHHWQRLSHPGIPKFQGVAHPQGNCGVGVYRHHLRDFDADAVPPTDPQVNHSRLFLLKRFISKFKKEENMEGLDHRHRYRSVVRGSPTHVAQ